MKVIWIRTSGMERTDRQEMHLLKRKIGTTRYGPWVSWCGKQFSRRTQELKGVRKVFCRKCKTIGISMDNK